MIKCKNCGEPNSIDRILCLSCGKKLDFSDPLALEILSKEKEIKAKPVKVRMAGDDIFSRLLSYFLFFLVCAVVFLFLYTGHIPQSELKLSAARTLDFKLKALSGGPGGYTVLGENELNVYIERAIAPLRESIVKAYPSWFVFRKCFATLGDSELMLHLLFNFRGKDIIFSFRGLPSVSGQTLMFETHSTFAGRLLVPGIIGRFVSSKILKIISASEALKILQTVTSLKTDKGAVIIFTGRKAGEDGTENPADDDANLPDDLLLIQAGDNFFSRKLYDIAFKYYHIASLKFPNSPLKSHAVRQMKLCAGAGAAQ